MVSRTKRGRFRRLHCVTACPLIPGLHYKEFDDWGEILPGEADIDAVCDRCLPGGRASLPPEEPDVESDSSSSSGESEPEARAPKRQKAGEASATAAEAES